MRVRDDTEGDLRLMRGTLRVKGRVKVRPRRGDIWSVFVREERHWWNA